MRRLILLSVTGCLLLACGCEPSMTYRDWLMQGEQACTEKKYDEAIRHLTQYINAAGGSPEAARAHYLRGVALAELSRRQDARQDLQRAAAFPGQADVCWRANSVLGTLDYEDGRWAEAAKYYEAVAEIARRSRRRTCSYSVWAPAMNGWAAGRMPGGFSGGLSTSFHRAAL